MNCIVFEKKIDEKVCQKNRIVLYCFRKKKKSKKLHCIVLFLKRNQNFSLLEWIVLFSKKSLNFYLTYKQSCIELYFFFLNHQKNSSKKLSCIVFEKKLTKNFVKKIELYCFWYFFKILAYLELDYIVLFLKRNYQKNSSKKFVKKIVLYCFWKINWRKSLSKK